YRDASLVPGVYEALLQQVQVATQTQAASLAPPTSAGPASWGPTPAASFSTGPATDLIVNEQVAAEGDYGSPSPRAFDWNYVYLAPDPTITGEPHLRIGVEPADGSHDASDVLLRGAFVQTLGFPMDGSATVTLDKDHRNESSITTGDFDGDGVTDYLIHIPHFSKAWITAGMLFTTIDDMSFTSAGHGFGAISLLANAGQNKVA